MYFPASFTNHQVSLEEGVAPEHLRRSPRPPRRGFPGVKGDSQVKAIQHSILTKHEGDARVSGCSKEVLLPMCQSMLGSSMIRLDRIGRKSPKLPYPHGRKGQTRGRKDDGMDGWMCEFMDG